MHTSTATRFGGNVADLSEIDRIQVRTVRKRKIELMDEIEHIKNELKNVDNELEAMYYVDETGKARQKVISNGRKRFNTNPATGIQYLIDRKIIEKEPRSVGEFIFQTEGLSKTAVGDYLGLHDEFEVQVLDEFTKCFDFTNLFVVDALRLFLKSFRLPGESQKIDRVMDSFSRQYIAANPTSFPSADACHSIAFSCIMLNTLMYNPNIKEKMVAEGYVSMCRDYVEQNLVSVEVLNNIYESIRIAQFALPREEKGGAEIHLNADREGWLYKQSSSQFITGPLSWKRRWFVLSDQCLYYFDQAGDDDPKGIIPLQNVGIRRIEAASRPHMFEIYSLANHKLKSCKAEQDGKLIEGRHTVYRICAANQEDLRTWMKAIDGSIAHYPVRPRSTH